MNTRNRFLELLACLALMVAVGRADSFNISGTVLHEGDSNYMSLTGDNNFSAFAYRNTSPSPALATNCPLNTQCIVDSTLLVGQNGLASGWSYNGQTFNGGVSSQFVIHLSFQTPDLVCSGLICEDWSGDVAITWDGQLSLRDLSGISPTHNFILQGTGTAHLTSNSAHVGWGSTPDHFVAAYAPYDLNGTASEVPEPATIGTLFIGLVGLVSKRKKIAGHLAS
jgi:hypothetical protein